MARIDNVKKPTESYCVGCGRTYEIDNFYKSINPWHATGVLPYCKECCKSISQHYLKQMGSMEATIFVTSAEIGVPYIKDAYDMYYTKLQGMQNKPGSNYNYIGNYITCLGIKRGQKERWKTFADTDASFNELCSVKKEEQVFKLDEERFVLDWGDHDKEDYEFLEYRYDVYTNGVSLTPAQETLYRQLCLVELSKRSKEKKHETTDTEQKMILGLMAKLKIDQFADSAEKSLIEQLLETQIKEMEEKEPAELYDQPQLYKDFCGIGTYWNDNILRTLKNLLAGSKDYPKVTKDHKGGE